MGLERRRLRRKACAALATTAGEDGAARTGAHPQTEAVGLGTTAVIGLERPLAHCGLSLNGRVSTIMDSGSEEPRNSFAAGGKPPANDLTTTTILAAKGAGALPAGKVKRQVAALLRPTHGTDTRTQRQTTWPKCCQGHPAGEPQSLTHIVQMNTTATRRGRVDFVPDQLVDSPGQGLAWPSRHMPNTGEKSVLSVDKPGDRCIVPSCGYLCG